MAPAPHIAVYTDIEQETEGSSELRLHGEDASALEALVYYVSWSTYFTPQIKSVSTPVFHLRVLSLSVAYRVCGLGSLAWEKYHEALEGDFWRTKDFADTIDYLYGAEFNAELSDMTLRNYFREAIVKVASRHLDQLNSPALEFRDFRIALNAKPEFKQRVTEDAALLLLSDDEASAGSARKSEPGKTSMQSTRSTGDPTEKPYGRSTNPVRSQALAVRPKMSVPSSTPVRDKKRKRSRSSSPSGGSRRSSAKCEICGTFFYVAPSGARNTPYSQQCRACADQLERRA